MLMRICGDLGGPVRILMVLELSRCRFLIVENQCKSGFSINLCGIVTICGGLRVLKGCRGL